MVNSVMPKLEYFNPPKYKVYTSYRKYLRKASNYSCAYCTISESESPGATFNIEHFRPQKFFPELSNKCENLRYSCPRCNSYKGDLWISELNGCKRKCDECKQRVCKNNIERFVNSLSEEPSKMIFLGKDDKLYAYNEYKPANYTIKYLRLNRAQLVKLRHIRRFMESWLLELENKREKAIGYLENIRERKQIFSTTKGSSLSKKEKLYGDVVETMYEMMLLQAEQSILLIDEEIRKLNFLSAQRLGCDEMLSHNGAE